VCVWGGGGWQGGPHELQTTIMLLQVAPAGLAHLQALLRVTNAVGLTVFTLNPAGNLEVGM
jgi:hypothetical protein